MLPVAAEVGRVKPVSHLHFDGEPGRAPLGVLQTSPVFCDQLVQLGRLKNPLVPAWHTTLSTRTVTTLPLGLPHPASVVTSRQVSPSLFTASADPRVTSPGDA